MQYSNWIQVPAQEDRGTWIDEIVEGKKFQIRTDKKIDADHDIRWFINGLTSPFQWFILTTEEINANECNRYTPKGTEGFLQNAGVLTFLKSTTQLQIWFDDVLEVTWVYEDDGEGSCNMKQQMTGMKFQTHLPKYDTVSTHYRYQLGKYIVISPQNMYH